MLPLSLRTGGKWTGICGVPRILYYRIPICDNAESAARVFSSWGICEF